MDAVADRRLPAVQRRLRPGDHRGARPRRRGGRAADHGAAGARPQRRARPCQDAVEQHLRPVHHHHEVSRRLRGLLGAPAGDRAHRRRHPAAGNFNFADPDDSAGRRDFPLHVGIRHKEPDGAVGDPSLDRHSGAAAGAGRGERRQFRRLHQGIPARSRCDGVAALRPRNQRRQHRDQRQQRQCRRRAGRARTAELRGPRPRAGPQPGRPRQYRCGHARHHADPGARPRHAQLHPPGAPGHPGQGREPGYDRGHRPDAQVPVRRRSSGICTPSWTN
jgi:hypothetical protein